MWRLCLAAAALVLGGCAATSRQALPADMVSIPGVPDFQQQARSDDCAGVALASLLGHAGIVIAPAAIDAEVYDPRLRGALLADLEQFATKAGARPRSGRGTLTELRQLLSSGIPVLVPLDLGWGPWRRPHYVVLFGFNEQAFLLHRRADETITMAATEFEQRWTAMGRLRLYLER
jgi:ABC-type bacteriocin/lantibiotic exporter with double-glycine peptidase domain